MTDEERREELAQYVKEQLKPKVPEKRVPVDPEVATKVFASRNNPPPPKKLPLDYNRMLIKAHQHRNKKCGKIIPQLGTEQNKLEPLVVLRAPNQHTA